MKVLIIGFGSIARKHVDALKAIAPKVQIVALRSGVNSNTIEGILSVKELKDIDIAPDFSIISNPTSMHYQTIRDMIPFGKPLFIEKPSLGSLEGSASLLNEIKSSGLTTYVACNLRFHPVINYLKKHIDDSVNKLNEVNIYCGSYLPDWRPGTDYRESYSAKQELGGGVHLDLIHELDYCYWLFGNPLEVDRKLTSNSSLGINAVDYANYQLRYKEFSVNIVLNYYRRDPKRSIELIFENKTIIGDLIESKIVDNKNEVLLQNVENINTYENQMNYFLRSLESNEQPMNSFEESIDVLRICLEK